MLASLRPAFAATLLLALPGCGGPKPGPPVTTLGAPTDSLVTSFGDVSDAAWLGGDRWAVLAQGDDAAALADLTSHETHRLGGRGAEEIRNPSGLFRGGDTLFVNDWGLRRTTVWTLQGKAVRTMPASNALRGILPRARDAAGHFYYEIAPRPGADGQGNRDSAAVIRAVAGGEKADTVARLAPLDLAEVEGDAGHRFERRVFSGADRWGVLPTGSIWVARVYENRVVWRDPGGTWRRGELLPDRVLEVTRYDRELFLRNYPPELRSTAEQLPFAAVKPPFETALTAPDGRIWLEKSRAPVDSARRYHVVDSLGILRREIRVPGRGRIIAVGDTAVLVAAPSRDGMHLFRFAVPPDSPAR